MVDVFISYPRTERDRAELIKDRLAALGLDVFFDLEGIDGGANFPDVIDTALRNSNAVLCAWSPLYFRRPWCLVECRNAKTRNILVPVTTEGFDPLAPPADLQGLNYYDLCGWAGDGSHEEWQRTLRRVGDLIGRPLVPAGEHGETGAEIRTSPQVLPHSFLLDDLRRTWADFPARDEADVVERFLDRVRLQAQGSGLEFEVEHHLNILCRNTPTEQEAHTNSIGDMNFAYWKAFEPVAKNIGAITRGAGNPTRKGNYATYPLPNNAHWLWTCAGLVRRRKVIGPYIGVAGNFAPEARQFFECSLPTLEEESGLELTLLDRPNNIFWVLTPDIIADPDDKSDWPRQHQWLAMTLMSLQQILLRREDELVKIIQTAG